LPVKLHPEVIRGTEIRVLSDAELFAMLSDRPLAVLGSSEHSHVVFLDEMAKD
jgi:hypothetical protein